KSAFAGGVGQRFDPAVIAVVTAVERGLADALGLGRLSELLADRLGGLDVAAVSCLFAAAARRRHRHAFQVLDARRVNMLGTAEDRKPRPLGGTDDLRAHVASPPQLADPLFLLLVHVSPRPPCQSRMAKC